MSESLETKLRAIWDRYQPQRVTEQQEGSARLQAQQELSALNARRASFGLPPVREHYEQDLGQYIQAQSQAQLGHSVLKTWRDVMNEELLRCIGSHFA